MGADIFQFDGSTSTTQEVPFPMPNNNDIYIFNDLETSQILVSDLQIKITSYEFENDSLKRKIEKQEEEITKFKFDNNKLNVLNIELQDSRNFVCFYSIIFNHSALKFHLFSEVISAINNSNGIEFNKQSKSSFDPAFQEVYVFMSF